jgi:hypothetical protein
MTHSLANLEHHHFKYRPFRRPGDVHVHFFGTAYCVVRGRDRDAALATCSKSKADAFTLPLRNTLAREATPG